MRQEEHPLANYNYPDRNDKLTIELISKGYDGKYWGESEKNVLNYALSYVESLEKREKMLDLGCAGGRLFETFLPLVGHIDGIEPDPERCAAGMETAKKFPGRVTVRNGDISILAPDDSYDVMLISHILQHIPDSSIYYMLRRAKEAVRDDGLLIVTTTYTDKDETVYTKEYWQDGKRMCEEVEPEDFDDVFKEKDTLPVRLFAEKHITELFDSYGFKLVGRKFYHYEEHHSIGEDEAANTRDDGRGARDIMYIFRKEPVKLLDANVLYHYSFSYYKEDVIDKVHIKLEDLKGKLRKKFPECVFETDENASQYPFFNETHISADFLHGGGLGLPFKTFRVVFPQFDLKMTDANVTGTTVHMAIFPEVSIAQISICLQLEDCKEDFLVYMRHVQGNGRKLINKDGRELTIQNIYDFIADALDEDITDLEAIYFTEITRYGDYESVEEVHANHKRELYGMMCGDEGYRHVPEELAEVRLANSWGSREFTRLSTFGTNTILVNLNKSASARMYRENRRSFDNIYYGDINPYFLIESKTAGVNHGIIFSLEMVMVAKTICNRILSRQSDYHSANKGITLSDNIKRTMRFRSELITTLKKIENLSISEIGELEQVLIKGQQIESLIEKIKYLLELLESELELLYQNSTNRLVNILTIAGLLLTVIGMFFEFM